MLAHTQVNRPACRAAANDPALLATGPGGLPRPAGPALPQGASRRGRAGRAGRTPAGQTAGSAQPGGSCARWNRSSGRTRGKCSCRALWRVVRSRDAGNPGGGPAGCAVAKVNRLSGPPPPSRRPGTPVRNPMAPARPELPARLLRDVSRSFCLTLRVLPRRFGSPSGWLAGAHDRYHRRYRMGSTGATPGRPARPARADSGPGRKRRRWIWASWPSGRGAGGAASVGARRSERGAAAATAARRSAAQLVGEVLDTITSGQELDLQRFAGASTGALTALRTDAELEDYTCAWPAASASSGPTDMPRASFPPGGAGRRLSTGQRRAIRPGAATGKYPARRGGGFAPRALLCPRRAAGGAGLKPEDLLAG